MCFQPRSFPHEPQQYFFRLTFKSLKSFLQFDSNQAAGCECNVTRITAIKCVPSVISSHASLCVCVFLCVRVLSCVYLHIPKEVPEEEYDPRSLFERLQEQKDKKQEEYEEQFKFSKTSVQSRAFTAPWSVSLRVVSEAPYPCTFRVKACMYVRLWEMSVSHSCGHDRRWACSQQLCYFSVSLETDPSSVSLATSGSFTCSEHWVNLRADCLIHVITAQGITQLL